VCVSTPQQPGDVVLHLDALNIESDDPFGTRLKDISLALRAGEIVGIAGISGNGQQELLKAISGERPLGRRQGAINMFGQDVGGLNAAQRRQRGLGFVPEERLGRGAVPDLSLADNALLTGYVPPATGMVKRGLVKRGAVGAFARDVIERFKVKCGGERSAAASLSGGNLQKFIVGREIMLAPTVMVFAQPTWGVDIGAAMLIRQAIIDMRNAGVAVLVLSEEIEELFMLSDRIAVLADGRLSRAVPVADTSINEVGVWMSGDFNYQGAQNVPA